MEASGESIAAFEWRAVFLTVCAFAAAPPLSKSKQPESAANKCALFKAFLLARLQRRYSAPLSSEYSMEYSAASPDS